MSTNETFFAFLAGYLDAEGNIGVYHNAASLRVGTYDRNILFQIQRRLKKDGIFSTLVLDRPKGSKINLSSADKFKIGWLKGYKTKSDFWRLSVYRKKDLLKLLVFVGRYFKHPRMKKGVAITRENIYCRNKTFKN